MATGTSRALLTRDDVMALLDGDDVELDDHFAPGSDDELGFDVEESEGEEKYDNTIR